MQGVTTVLSDAEIKQACKFAEQAYSENIKGATRFDSKLGTTAFYLYKNDVQYIIFRGTNGDPSDWLMNLSAIPWRINGKWAHGGFVAAQNSVWKAIRKRLDPAKKTYCIGHSLGGACAILTAHRLVSGKRPAFKDVRCITFGRPNVWLKSKKRLKEMVNVSGLIVTKLDGSARGGVIVALAEKFGLPVHAVGVGEAIDDLRAFNAKVFAKSLMGLD